MNSDDKQKKIYIEEDYSQNDSDKYRWIITGIMIPIIVALIGLATTETLGITNIIGILNTIWMDVPPTENPVEVTQIVLIVTATPHITSTSITEIVTLTVDAPPSTETPTIVTPSPTVSSSPSATASDTITPVPQSCTMQTTDGNVEVRIGPERNPFRKLDENIIVRITGYAIINGKTWWQIDKSDVSDGFNANELWISEESNLIQSGNCDIVPQVPTPQIIFIPPATNTPFDTDGSTQSQVQPTAGPGQPTFTPFPPTAIPPVPPASASINAYCTPNPDDDNRLYAQFYLNNGQQGQTYTWQVVENGTPVTASWGNGTITGSGTLGWLNNADVVTWGMCVNGVGCQTATQGC